MKTEVVFVLLITSIEVNAGVGNWLDKVKQTTEEIKQKTQETKENAQRAWQESERHCVDCGKVVHGRDRCTSCEARRLAEQANEAKQKAQQAWQESERRCIDCGKVIHGRERCTTCESKRLQQGVQQAKRTWDENKDQWRENARQTVQNTSAAITEFASNPEKQREVVRKVAEFKRDLDVTIIKSVPVVDPNTGNIVPFGLMAENMVREAGIGGNFGADPVRCAYMMMIDSDYLFNGAQLIESPSGQYVTLSEAMAIVQRSPFAINRDAVETASRASTQMRSAYRSGDAMALSQASREFTAAITTLQPHRHSSTLARESQIWAGFDSGLAALAVSTSGFYESLWRYFRSLGTERDLAQLLAVLVMAILFALAFILLRRIFTIGLRHKLADAEKELRDLNGTSGEAPRAETAT
jgi:hypothetical protein